MAIRTSRRAKATLRSSMKKRIVTKSKSQICYRGESEMIPLETVTHRSYSASNIFKIRRIGSIYVLPTSGSWRNPLGQWTGW